MSVSITLYKNFSKKRNSTKQPTGGTTANVVFKDKCSIDNPVFLIDGVDLAYNYLQFNGTYYFIDDIVLSNNKIYELYCSKDVLATYKTNIGSYNGFVERAASSYDVKITDSAISPSSDIRSYVVANTTVGALSGSGCFMVQVLGQDGIDLYACASLYNWGKIVNPASYQAQDVLDWIDTKIGQAFDLDVYIGTIKWLPISATVFEPAGGEGPLGALTVGPVQFAIDTSASNAVYLANQNYGGYTPITSLNMPSGLPYNDFRLCDNRFCQWEGYFPGVGTVELDGAIFGGAVLNSQSIECDVAFDITSGNILYKLCAYPSETPFAILEGNVAVNVPIGKSSFDTGKQITSLTSGIASIAGAVAKENYVAAGAAALGTAVNAAQNFSTPQVSLISASGNKGMLKQNKDIQIGCRARASKDIPTAVYGRPLHEFKTLSTLSGFIKCNAASIDIPGEGPDKDAVNAYLNSGFYYE